MSKRTEQLSTEIARKLSMAIAEIFPMEQSGVFTIRNVDVTTDLQECKIHISRMGGDEDFFERLGYAQNRIKKSVFADMRHLHHIPTLTFLEDFSGEYTQNLVELSRMFHLPFVRKLAQG